MIFVFLLYMKREVITTRDGSSTITIPEMKVMYHSIHGAISESMHVYIQAGLHYAVELFSDTPLRVFEMGFGSGLNALLTAIEARRQERAVHYYSVEAFPLIPEEISALNYGNALQEQALFEYLHQAPWNQPEFIGPVFMLEKMQATLADCTLDQLVHVIYYDAFAPAAQPELWTKGVFEKLYNMLVPEGILVTYCSKGDVRRALQTAGFSVSKLQGPPGKREMLRAKR
jgi:tRNA U34 5-methylaminomethyl-2-thiouridine-forming methyltransferase MnmC